MGLRSLVAVDSIGGHYGDPNFIVFLGLASASITLAAGLITTGILMRKKQNGRQKRDQSPSAFSHDDAGHAVEETIFASGNGGHQGFKYPYALRRQVHEWRASSRGTFLKAHEARAYWARRQFRANFSPSEFSVLQLLPEVLLPYTTVSALRAASSHLLGRRC
jgi:hypothetical protein